MGSALGTVTEILFAMLDVLGITQHHWECASGISAWNRSSTEESVESLSCG